MLNLHKKLDFTDILGLEKDFDTFINKNNKDSFLLKIDNLINEFLGKDIHQYISISIDKIEEKMFV